MKAQILRLLVQVLMFQFLHHGHGVRGKFSLFVFVFNIYVSAAVFTIFEERSVFQKWTEEDFAIADQEWDSVGRNKSLWNIFKMENH